MKKAMKRVVPLFLCIVLMVSTFGAGFAMADDEDYKSIVVANSDTVVALDPSLAEDSFSCIVVGNTLPDMLITMALCVVVNKLVGKARK